MDLQTPLKHSLSKMFRLCKSSDVSDVIQCPRQHCQLVELFSPKPHESIDTWEAFERQMPESKRTRERKPSKKGRRNIAKRDNTTTWATINSNNNYYDWSTSDDDMDTDKDDKNTLFSSDSSDSFFRPRPHHNRRNRLTKSDANDLADENDGFAVVKRSTDPYNDFRSSMVEMIIEKQIFGAKELEGLLDTFLSLNSSHYHMVIVEVFMEIWDTLFL